MKKEFRKFKSALLTIALACLCPFSAFANPSDLDLSFVYNSSGRLAVDVKFDSPATTRCIARHRVSLYYEDQVLGDDGVIRKSAYNRVVTPGRTSTSLRARRLLGAKKKDGKDPIMAIQTRLVCGSEQIDSNIEARYVQCGDKTERLSLSKYLSELKKKLS